MGSCAKGSAPIAAMYFPVDGDLSTELSCRVCSRAGGLRPHVVWFGEMPRFMDESMDAICSADLFVSIGTSGSVYPAAGFAAQAASMGVPAMELNLEPSENAHVFANSHYGPATEIVPAWVKRLDKLVLFRNFPGQQALSDEGLLVCL